MHVLTPTSRLQVTVILFPFTVARGFLTFVRTTPLAAVLPLDDHLDFHRYLAYQFPSGACCTPSATSSTAPASPSPPDTSPPCISAGSLRPSTTPTKSRCGSQGCFFLTFIPMAFLSELLSDVHACARGLSRVVDQQSAYRSSTIEEAQSWQSFRPVVAMACLLVTELHPFTTPSPLPA